MPYLKIQTNQDLPVDSAKTLAKKSSALVSAEIAVETARIYIEFSDAARKMWGWDKGTF